MFRSTIVAAFSFTVTVLAAACFSVSALAADAAPAAAPAPTVVAAPAPANAPVMPVEVSAPAEATPAETTAHAEGIKGVLIGNNVNIRSGPSTECSIYLTAPISTEVTVIGKQGDWLQVEFPAQQYSWVGKEFVQEQGPDAAVVSADNVNVRSGPGAQFDRAYSAPKGFKLHVIEKDATGAWLHVAPTADESAWVRADYVNVGGAVPEVASGTVPAATTGEATAEAGTWSAKMKEAEDAYAAEKKKENIADWDLPALETMYKDIAENTPIAVDRALAQRRLQQMANYETIRARKLELAKVDEDMAAKQSDLEKQRQQEVAAVSGTQEPAPIATGTIQKFYITGLGGATHKLVVGDSILYLLKSSTCDLSQFEGKDVAIRGTIESKPGLNVRVIDVTGISENK